MAAFLIRVDGGGSHGRQNEALPGGALLRSDETRELSVVRVAAGYRRRREDQARAGWSAAIAAGCGCGTTAASASASSASTAGGETCGNTARGRGGFRGEERAGGG